MQFCPSCTNLQIVILGHGVWREGNIPFRQTSLWFDAYFMLGGKLGGHVRGSCIVNMILQTYKLTCNWLESGVNSYCNNVQ